jgi:hypothetical protein
MTAILYPEVYWPCNFTSVKMLASPGWWISKNVPQSMASLSLHSGTNAVDDMPTSRQKGRELPSEGARQFLFAITELL